ncbi:MAG: hypothetical protein EOM64_09315, partial [Erysipelotrichia bacterium]|nr:hypothetical protein [Erysipelotrichia bacterium]
MNWKEEWLEEFAGKKILIWGFGREGRSTYRLIRTLLPEQQVDIAEGRNGGSEILKRAEELTVHA